MSIENYEFPGVGPMMTGPNLWQEYVEAKAKGAVVKSKRQRALEKFKGSPNPYYALWAQEEAIDIIAASMTDEELVGYAKGCFLKYRLRMGDKPEQELEKELFKSNQYRQLAKDLLE